MQLDHAVVNTQYALDRAQTCFEALGFNLTERGYHSLGSINHLMMFGTDYLELIGLPDSPTQAGQARPTRAGVSDAPLGINGVVFKTDSADATYQHLQEVGMAGDPPKSFTRPVVFADESLDGETQTCEASFRTVHVRPDCFPAGRVYFCEHHTPELVWRPEWQQHDNGAASIAAIVLVAPDAAEQAAAFASLLELSAQALSDDEYRVTCDGFAIEVINPTVYSQQYAQIADRPIRAGSFFGALKVRTSDPVFLEHAAEKLRYAHRIEQAGTSAARIVVRQPDFNTILDFVAI